MSESDERSQEDVSTMGMSEVVTRRCYDDSVPRLCDVLIPTLRGRGRGTQDQDNARPTPILIPTRVRSKRNTRHRSGEEEDEAG